MERIVDTVTITLSQLTIIGDAILVGAGMVFLLGLVGVKFEVTEKITKLVWKHGLWLALFVALLAMMGSLFFSEGAGFEPCKLCWFQRILMYPQVIILLLAALRRDKKVAIYSLSLSLVGLVIALYHYYVQVSGVEILPCSVVGYSVSCTKNFFLRYGYITIVVMSATAFGLISMLMAIVLNEKEDNSQKSRD